MCVQRVATPIHTVLSSASVVKMAVNGQSKYIIVPVKMNFSGDKTRR